MVMSHPSTEEKKEEMYIQKNSPRQVWRAVEVMGAFLFVVFSILLAKHFFFANSSTITRMPPPFDAPYKQMGSSTNERVEDLLSRMTLEEKIGQMALVEKNSVRTTQDIATYGIGALLSGGGAKPNINTVQGWSDMVSHFVDASKTSRLGIPILYGVDANHGHSNVPGATVFPHFIGLGATGDPALVEQVARTTAQELAATGIYWSFSPTLDLPKDIRWGRTYEAFSDDSKLTASLGAAYMKGLQIEKKGGGMSSSTIFVLGTPKHYIGAGSMAWGSSSNKHFHIDQGMTPKEEVLFRESYLPPFIEAVHAGAQGIMIGLNSWGDTKLSAEKHLITDVLKGEIGFTGFAVSDWYAVYEIPGGDYHAAVTAINAGIDMVMLPFDYKSFIKNVTSAVRRGDIAQSRIDDAVRRVLRAKFEMGLFDGPRMPPIPESVGSDAHRSLAREAVAESLVLLKNETAVLPISSHVTHIRVAGSSADNVGRQMGAWTVEWQGVDGNWVPGGTSILAGIRARARAGDGVEVEYDSNGTFASSTALADIGIAVVGEAPYAEGWGDSENLTLSDADRAAIARLKAVSKKVVVVVVSGRPLMITDEILSWDATVAAWLPGSEGAGVADALFGDKPFRGKLPLPWPARMSQLPIASDGHTADGTAPLFPRYFGLQ